MQNLYFSEHNVLDIPHLDEIVKIFPREECDVLNWNSAASTFTKFVQLLQFEPYTYNVMLGLICSIGALTETLVNYLIIHIKYGQNY